MNDMASDTTQALFVSFFGLPRELRQMVLFQIVDLNELEECTRIHTERPYNLWMGDTFFLCHHSYSERIFGWWNVLQDLRPCVPDTQRSCWSEEVSFVSDGWYRELRISMHKFMGVRGCTRLNWWGEAGLVGPDQGSESETEVHGSPNDMIETVSQLC